MQHTGISLSTKTAYLQRYACNARSQITTSLQRCGCDLVRCTRSIRSRHANLPNHPLTYMREANVDVSSFDIEGMFVTLSLWNE